MKVSTLIHASGVPFEQIAEAVGVSITSVHNWVAGRNAPTSSKYQALARVLGVPVSRVATAAGRTRSAGKLSRTQTVAGFVSTSPKKRGEAESLALDALSLSVDILGLDPAHRATVTDLVHSLSKGV